MQKPKRTMSINNSSKPAYLTASSYYQSLDSGVTPNMACKKENYKKTGELLEKTFHMPMGDTTYTTELLEYHHKVREPVRKVDIVTGPKNDLTSTGKYRDTRYVICFDQDEVNIYDTNSTIITVT